MIRPFTQQVVYSRGNEPPVGSVAHFTVVDRSRGGALVTLRVDDMRVTFAADKLEKILERTRNTKK